MNKTIPIAPPRPACFGVMCPLHGECARYLAVNGTQADAKTIGTCHTPIGYPQFQQVAPLTVRAS